MSDEDIEKIPRTRSRRSFPLRVAFRFPSRKNKSVSMPVSTVALSNDSASESDSDLDEPRGPNFLEKRALNIKENKAMVNAALFLIYLLTGSNRLSLPPPPETTGLLGQSIYS